MIWRKGLIAIAVAMLASGAAAKKLTLDADIPGHWDEVGISEMFATEVVADMVHTVRVPDAYSWMRSGNNRRIGWRKDLKQIRAKKKPKIRYGYFLSRLETSIFYNEEKRRFERTVDDDVLTMQEYLETLDVMNLSLTPLVIDDHDVLLVEGMMAADPLRLVLIAENIGSSALQITFVCDEGECRDPSTLVWQVFRESLLKSD